MDGRYPVRVSGPLAPLVHTFRAELVRRGFTPRSAQDNAYVLAHLSRWLGHEGLAAVELTTERLNGFAEARRAAGYQRWRTVRSLRLMLGYLRELGAIPPEEHREIDCRSSKYWCAIARTCGVNGSWPSAPHASGSMSPERFCGHRSSMASCGLTRWTRRR